MLRTVIREAGPEALERHWPSTEDGLNVVRRLCRVPATPAEGLTSPAGRS
ncbi:hypothetical protein QIS99_09310 [Streptomyces sp. B-S-A8]|uniref:Uncharacterized protein n=1 Tax=Streptomyces solicavernae TaxID=3043614 RepID=A0ABT6RPU6_9ACTN|nr:hypothetical protein [Streptomyces sp. B-S-A8]MDI3386410.1 hypothetical protein [Streptomyces sp. B-S-A8]